MKHLLVSLPFVIPIMACGATVLPNEPDAGAPDAPSGDAAVGPLPTPACQADPAECLYAPPALPIELVTQTYTDPDRVGGPREIPIAIRYAPDAPRPMPIVIWSHGGAGGRNNPVTSLDQWAISAAERGYLSIAIAHVPRDQTSRDALCATLGFDATGCATFKYLSYDRPHDISFVIDRIAELAMQQPWADRIDLKRIAIGGHSAGAGGTLMVAGAPRDMNGTSYTLSDPRPSVFLAFSPQAPGVDGFTESSYAQITKPTLIGTGRGDEDTPPNTALGRASVFDAMPGGDKARIWIEDPAAIHGVFALEIENCPRPPVTPEHCREMASWVKSTGIAFLDAHLRGLVAAQAWIASSNLAVASGGVAEWSTK